MTPPIPNITPDEALARLAAIVREQAAHGPGYRDIEADHSEADQILCDLLTACGYGPVVEAWAKIYKWYA